MTHFRLTINFDHGSYGKPPAWTEALSCFRLDQSIDHQFSCNPVPILLVKSQILLVTYYNILHGGSQNRGTPNFHYEPSSYWGTPILGNLHM